MSEHYRLSYRERGAAVAETLELHRVSQAAAEAMAEGLRQSPAIVSVTLGSVDEVVRPL